jgi:gliding motility-associated-like protein
MAGATPQPCVNDYASFTYRGPREQYVSSSAMNSEYEFLLGGRTRTGEFVSMTDGWVAKLNAQGIVLWSKRYSFEDYNAIAVKRIAAIADGGFVALLNCHYQSGSSQVTRSASILIKADLYGNITWSKVISTDAITFYYSLYVLSSGDYIVAGSTGSSLATRRSPCHFIRINSNGGIVWGTVIAIDKYFFGFDPDGCAIELSNGNIVFGTHTFERDYDADKFVKAGFSVVVLNGNTGAEVWKKIYTTTGITDLAPLNQVYHLEHIREKINGDLMFYASYAETIPIPNPGYRKIMEIQTNATGVINQIRSYYNNTPGCMIIDGDANALLMDDAIQPVLFTLNDQGIVLQKAYGASSLKQQPAAIRAGGGSYHLFANDRESGKFIRYLRVGVSGELPCEETPVNVIQEMPGNILSEQPVTSSITNGSLNTLPDVAVWITDYPLEPVTECKLTCCNDVTFNAPPVERCNETSYQLPNGYTVTDSGTYYITYRRNASCDSIVFYHVSFPTPPVFSLGADTCFISADTVQLEAPAGYASYQWNGVNSNDNFFVARQPGIYWLQASNACGSSRDSIEVFEKCEFDIFIPSAFTPNGDNLNDDFGIPPLNRNRLLLLKIYNRWGELVFTTTSTARRWDGMFRGKEAPVGVYIYQLTMETVDRKKIIERKGSVTLIR